MAVGQEVERDYTRDREGGGVGFDDFILPTAPKFWVWFYKCKTAVKEENILLKPPSIEYLCSLITNQGVTPFP
jgi:hypothetical protein